MADDDRPDGDDEKVVRLFPAVEGPAATVSGFSHRACQHKRIDLDTEHRLAVCRACGAGVEVFDWLLKNAGAAWTRMWQQHQGIKKDAARLRRERDELKREVKNLKAQHRRWRNKQPPEEEVADVAIPLGPRPASSPKPV